VPSTLQQFGHFVQGGIRRYRFNDSTCLRHFETEELIPFAVVAFAGFEEPHQYLPLFLIPLRFYSFYDLYCFHLRVQRY
jgi:hypothetical protein